ncbi:MAG: dihydrofolate reductase family protein [Chloroflexota bacterium]
MRKLIAWEFLSLDGIMEAPENWVSPFQSEDVAEFVRAQNLASEALLLGRVTYETFAAFWPSQTHNEFGIADKLNSMPKFVVSSTLDQADWHNTTIIRRDVLEEIARLKQQPGGAIGITGSATLIQALMKANLIDEFRLLVHPIVLGNGKYLFGDENSTPLRLLQKKTFSSGVVALSYTTLKFRLVA